MSRGPPAVGGGRSGSGENLFGDSIDAARTACKRRSGPILHANAHGLRSFAWNVAAPAAFRLRRRSMVDNITPSEQRRSTRHVFLWGGTALFLVICAAILVWVFVFVPRGGPGRNGEQHVAGSTGLMSNEGSGQSAAAKNNAVTPQTNQKIGTGQNAPGAAAQIEQSAEPLKLSDQQRQQIRAYFANQKADRTGSVNFTLAIGSAVPQGVQLQSLPPQISAALGGYNADQYIIVGNQLVIVDTQARRVVAIVPDIG
jgi:hypothetical protein